MAMSRTRLAVVTALVLVGLAAVVAVTRYSTDDSSAGDLPGSSRWEVTLTVQGDSVPGKAYRVEVSNPPSFRRQYVYDVRYESKDVAASEGRASAAKDYPGRKTTLKPPTNPIAGAGAQHYLVTQKFRCTLGATYSNEAMKSGDRADNMPYPDSDQTLAATSRIESDHPLILKQADDLAKGLESKQEQYRAFHEYVGGLRLRDTDGVGSALDCLTKGGDDAGRARLLVALCRAREIPARVVTAIHLRDDATAVLHRWAEAWIDDAESGQWVPADPTFGHFGSADWPPSYIVVRLDDKALVRGPGSGAKVALHAEPLEKGASTADSPMRAFWRAVSFTSLPPAEQHLVRFVLVLPLGALVVGFFRVVVGAKTFGVFTPALLGLIFRDTRALPWGLGIFAGTVVVGWVFRKTLDRYSLLMVPRTAILLTMVCVFLLSVVILTARAGVHITGYVALFPLVILTHMVERFWTVEVEDGTWSAFKTLMGTIFVAVMVALAVGPPSVSQWFFRFPETLLVVVAGLLLLGRYTGYRLTELYRFQDVIELQAAKVPYVGNGTAVTSPVKTAEMPALPAPAGGKP